MCYETRDSQIARLCYERDDYKRMLKAAEEGMERLRQENEELKALCEKQARMSRTLAAVSLRLDQVTAERDALAAKLEGRNG